MRRNCYPNTNKPVLETFLKRQSRQSSKTKEQPTATRQMRKHRKSRQNSQKNPALQTKRRPQKGAREDHPYFLGTEAKSNDDKQQQNVKYRPTL